jgi:hypothetical protein
MVQDGRTALCDRGQRKIELKGEEEVVREENSTVGSHGDANDLPVHSVAKGDKTVVDEESKVGREGVSGMIGDVLLTRIFPFDPTGACRRHSEEREASILPSGLSCEECVEQRAPACFQVRVWDERVEGGEIVGAKNLFFDLFLCFKGVLEREVCELQGREKGVRFVENPRRRRSRESAGF